MKRQLIKQMRHEWRDNIWLILSLTIVFTVVWGGLLMIYFRSYGLTLPRGYDTTDVYSMNVRMIEKSSPSYIEDRAGAEKMKQDFGVLLRRLRELPEVEAAMFHWCGLPYTYDYMGNNIQIVGDSGPTYYGNTRDASPDIVDVLRLKSLTGATSKQLKEMLAKGEILISDNPHYTAQGLDPKNLKGKTVIFGGDSAKTYRVGDVIQNIRRTDYEPAWAGTILRPMDNENPWGMVAVRVKPGMGKKFEQKFKDNKDLRVYGNVFLTEFESMASVREACQRGTEIDLRQLIIVVAFVLLTIFLGLLGTFWFRVQQRVGEIAIRKICGASRRDILRRVISEGLILLFIAVILASAVLWIFIIPEFLKSEFGNPSLWKETLWVELAAIALVSCGIVVSLLYPALRAMKIEPAVAVKSE